MKVSLNCLNEFIDLKDLALDKLVQELTMRAFEVEDYHVFNDKLDERIVLGEILEISPHPNADKLQITKTAINLNPDGTKNIQQIVCGARNIAVGQKVPVATLGAKLQNVKGDFIEIKASKIREIESYGMLCGVEELAFSEDETKKIIDKQGDGIFLLADPNRADIRDITGSFPLGTPIKKVLGIETDTVLDIGARSNRGDALSIQGQARELSALFKLPLKELKFKDIETYAQENVSENISPEIADLKDTQLFYTLSVSGLKVKESPQWLKDRLEAMGMKSINNLVDISNYVQLVLGQPLHFYDREKLKGNRLTARRAAPGERILALDGITYELSEVNLVIADASSPVAIAGVMGGADTQITTETKSILIEAAIFYPATVRRSARAAGIDSEAKKRFERGVDKLNTLNAILMSLELLSEIATDTELKILGSLGIAGDEKIETLDVELNLASVSRILGLSLGLDEIKDLLSPLGIKARSETQNMAIFEIPSFRTKDILREIDLIEELARIYGYNNIPVQVPPMHSFQEISEDSFAKEDLENLLVAEGFNQVILSSLVSESMVEDLAIKMLNPLSKDYSVLRTSLLPALIKAAAKNYANDRSSDIKIFEFGKTYALKAAQGAENYTLADTLEINKVAVLMAVLEKSWLDEHKPLHSEKEFYELKSIVERLYPSASFLALDEQPLSVKKSSMPSAKLEQIMHPGIAAKVLYQGREIGYIAKIHPQQLESLEVPEKLYFMELELPRKTKSKFSKIIKNPPIERDITIDAQSNLRYAEITNAINKFKSKDLVAVKLLDLYEKSFTVRLRWHSEKDYTREEIDAEVLKLKEFLMKELSVAFRV